MKISLSACKWVNLPESKDDIGMAKTFEKAGIDLLQISSGMQSPTHPVPEGFMCSPITYSGCKIKKEVNIPVIEANEILTEEQVRFLIENDYADFVVIGRGMLADPEFANNVINDKPVNTCSGCERCFWLLMIHYARQGIRSKLRFSELTPMK
ncbi:hypothetical protein [Methanosarcina sp.]|uniref:hypothetical protein n=1 Tax=Methanosarcina sp. TaxID=2213 RepID=UPI002AB8DB0A|nr:hypothetical protein [Methanosarcina sp.]MDY9927887.1 hypothetical protein [Methanosarcina sp.]